MRGRPEKNRRHQKKQESVWVQVVVEVVVVEGGGLYRISCLALSHFFFHKPSVLQSELFGCPGRWQIGLVKGAAMIPTLQTLTPPHTPTFSIPNLQCASELSSQTSWQAACPWHRHTAVPPRRLFDDIVRRVVVYIACWERVRVSAGMDGRRGPDCKPLQVVLVEWLWEQRGLNLPL